MQGPTQPLLPGTEEAYAKQRVMDAEQALIGSKPVKAERGTLYMGAKIDIDGIPLRIASVGRTKVILETMNGIKLAREEPKKAKR